MLKEKNILPHPLRTLTTRGSHGFLRARVYRGNILRGLKCFPGKPISRMFPRYSVGRCFPGKLSAYGLFLGTVTYVSEATQQKALTQLMVRELSVIT